MIRNANDTFFTITLGTSAGGVDALRNFFQTVPDDCPHAFVVIQHLSTDHKSFMGSILERSTKLRIVEVSDSMTLEGGCIYLIPPGKNIVLENSLDSEPDATLRFRLTQKAARPALNLPIDIFLESMADTIAERSIAVILTGSGSDGTSGARSINERGGLVIVQDPDEAEFSSMPSAAIGTGCADIVLPIRDMYAELVRYTADIDAGRDDIERVLMRDTETTGTIIDRVRQYENVDFGRYKRPTLVRRIARRMALLQCPSIDDYLERLEDDPEEIATLHRDFMVGVTCFFRDTEAWELLADALVPMFESDDPEPVKVWCPGCCTGEEAYSIAILMTELRERLGSGREFKIFATDTSRSFLRTATTGVYPQEMAEHLTEDQLRRFFEPFGGGYRCKTTIRSRIVFSRHDLTTDPPFIRTNLISCRNLLIYLGEPTQRQIIETMSMSLLKGGVLFLGPAESLPGTVEGSFEVINKRWRLYRNRMTRKLSRLGRFNYTPAAQADTASVLQSTRARPTMAEARRSSALDFLLEVGGTTMLVLTPDYRVEAAYGQYRNYIQLSEEGFSPNISKMMPQNLSEAIMSLVRRTQTEAATVRHEPISVRIGDEVRRVSLSARIEPTLRSEQPTCLVVISEEVGPVTIDVGEQLSPDELANMRIRELEAELETARENLRTAAEELGVQNEELQASNEELMAANEELQSTNEEMQSLNEELHTVNAEQQLKNSELVAQTADMANLLNSTEISTIFLDRNLRIRRITPSIASQFNVTERDIGRPILHFTSTLGTQTSEQLASSAEQVMNSGESLEIEVPTQSGRFWLQRINPFLDADQNIDGVVVTFIDISDLKRAELALSEKSVALERTIEDTMAGYWDWRIQENTEYLSPSFKAMFGYEDHEMENTPESWQKIIHPDDLPGVLETFDRHVESKGEIPFANEVRYFHKDGSVVWVLCNGKVIEWDGQGKPVRMVGTHVNVTAMKLASEVVEEQAREIERFAFAASHDLREPLNTMRGCLDLIREENAVTPGSGEDLLRRASRAAESMDVMVRGLLEYARNQSDAVVDQACDLNDVLAGVLEEFGDAIERTSATIEVESLPTITGNPVAMHQLFRNLVGNAIKFTMPREAPEVRVSASDSDSGGWRIEVADRGIGIAPEHHGQVFGILERLHSDLEYSGSGIGLALCRRIVQQHSGEISVVSELGSGCTFRVDLPRRTAASEIAPTGKRASTAAKD